MGEIADAAAAIRNEGLVVYPTETVYGLGGLATSSAAITAVYRTKNRPFDKPISLAVHSVDAVEEYVSFGARERAFIDEFLPGPVTVICERRPIVPDVLTAGNDRVGVRIPDHPIALELLRKTGKPITATSANVSGQPSIREIADLDTTIRQSVSMTVDGGRLPGTASTVVDVACDTIYRHGARSTEVTQWLNDH